jgi:hypothetical protein
MSAAPITWTIANQDPNTLAWSSEKSLAGWGIAAAMIRLASQQTDVLTLSAPFQKGDANALFPYKSIVMLKQYGGSNGAGGTCFFYGIVTKTPAMGSARSERQQFEISGPWWYLTQTPYAQTWATFETVIDQPYRSHCVLNPWQQLSPGSNYNRQTTGWQITDAANYCINASPFPRKDASSNPLPRVPLNFTGYLSDATVPNIDIPSEEVRDIMCSEVILKQMRWMPDGVVWIDYSTAGTGAGQYPTLHVARRASLAPASLPIAGGGATEIAVNPRYDLLRPSVLIQYEQPNIVDGKEYLGLASQVYPPSASGAEVGAFRSTIELFGGSKNTVRGTIQVAAISSAGVNGDIHADSWWVAKQPWLANCTSAVIKALSLTNDPGYGVYRELLPDGGQVAPWMVLSGGGPVLAARTRVLAKIAYQCKFPNTNGMDPAGGPFTGIDGDIGTKDISVDIMLTNAPIGTNTYSAVASQQLPEIAPANLAQYIYEGVGTLVFDGSITFTQVEATQLVGLGNTLNLTGSSQSAWANMNAVVQAIDVDLVTGRTTVTFGPPKHLGGADLIELTRVNRYRPMIVNAATQLSPQIQQSADLGDITPLNNSAGGNAVRQTFGTNVPVASGPSGQNQGVAQLQGSALVGAAAGSPLPGPGNTSPPASNAVTTAQFCFHPNDLLGTDGNYHPVSFREIQYCDSGTLKRIIVPCSQPY